MRTFRFALKYQQGGGGVVVGEGCESGGAGVAAQTAHTACSTPSPTHLGLSPSWLNEAFLCSWWILNCCHHLYLLCLLCPAAAAPSPLSSPSRSLSPSYPLMLLVRVVVAVAVPNPWADFWRAKAHLLRISWHVLFANNTLQRSNRCFLLFNNPTKSHIFDHWKVKSFSKWYVLCS